MLDLPLHRSKLELIDAGTHEQSMTHVRRLHKPYTTQRL
jgi:hypothetical protein